MKKEVIREFLNLPGIAGVALMDGRSRPYFLGVDQALNFQQKEALAQGIRQVVETTPDNFGVFEFQFSTHQVHIYKLASSLILLALTNQELVESDYYQVITRLKETLLEDVTNATATFRLLAGNITLPGQRYWGSQTTTATATRPPDTPASAAPAPVTPPPVTPAPTAPSPAVSIGDRNGSLQPSPTAATLEPTPPKSPTSITLADMLLALNSLSQFTTQFLGTPVIVNYWKSTRPEAEWLKGFEVSRSARIELSSSMTQGPTSALSPEQQQWIRAWVAALSSAVAR
ncbi:hypothetical protein OOK60_09040 [Trichothermofontia sichuanensis B231]|uniref:hypothetical protein n=1 Tax=Trichothermofontia sichuanensis TaxID=3045816 RepID=UPI0022459FD6|nr:hypothetical protein [Trichothermofontia sichuanensis]UZQ56176.1 hypothetical protein OOK60_09040 [Trichothermofontia sichuanensis B231]